MTLFDLIFIVVFLGAVVTIVRIAVFAIRGRLARAIRSALGLAAVLGIYAAALIAVSLASPGRTVPIGEE